MTTLKLLLLPGDGIGPEVMAEVEKIIDHFGSEGIARFEIEKGLVGGCAYDAHGQAISDADMALAAEADAVLLAAVGGPKWDGVPYDVPLWTPDRRQQDRIGLGRKRHVRIA